MEYSSDRKMYDDLLMFKIFFIFSKTDSQISNLLCFKKSSLRAPILLLNQKKLIYESHILYVYKNISYVTIVLQKSLRSDSCEKNSFVKFVGLKLPRCNIC